jgi:hypothetical protein
MLKAHVTVQPKGQAIATTAWLCIEEVQQVELALV